MKKISLMPFVAMCVLSLCSCADDLPDRQSESPGRIGIEEPDTSVYATITFSCQGWEMGRQAMTRGELTADGSSMTDLWLLDYMGDDLQQTIHQEKNDEDFGTPTVSLAPGSHHLYFIVSRGSTPTLSTATHSVTWEKPSDTFYKDLALTVTASANDNRNVTLERCVTKLKIAVTDAIIDNVAKIYVTPATWYNGLDYISGLPCDARTNEPRPVNIPESYKGRSDLTLSIFGFSAADEWTTNVTVTAVDSNEATISTVSLTDAPLVVNRETTYSGWLFTNSGRTTLTLSTDWLTEYTATW